MEWRKLRTGGERDYLAGDRAASRRRLESPRREGYSLSGAGIRCLALLTLAACAVSQAGVLGSGDKLTEDEKIELLRGLDSEFATMKVPLARSKKPLELFVEGTFNRQYWEDAFRAMGPAARAGEQVRITKVTFQGDKLLLDINGGISSGRHWYDNIQTGVGGTTQSQVDNSNRGSTPTLGTYILVVWRKPMEGLTSAAVKKILSPIMDFDQRSATQLYSETLTPEMQQAITEKRPLVGMTRDQVKMAMGGPPDTHGRETTKDGIETEYWIFGKPPGKITFVTFAGSKAITVKDEYAGLGGDVVQH
jgi:hypothetical protein